MVIYNTTYHVAAAQEKRFILWLRQEYIPAATASGLLSRPQLTRIITAAPDQQAEGTSVALQFHAASIDVLEVWYRQTGQRLVDRLTADFGQDVAGFSTLMEKLDIE